NAADEGQVARRAWAQAGDLAQRGVVEDHVGWYALFAREPRAHGAQGLEQRLVRAGHLHHRAGGAGLAAAGPAAHARRLLAQQHLAAALQHVAAVRGQAQPAVALVIDLQQARGHELPEHAAPFAGVQVGADAVGAERVVAERPDALRLRPAQDIDQVGGAEALPGAVDAGQRFLRRHRRVPGFRRRQAVVTVAAGLAGPLRRVVLAEAGQQHLAA